MKNFVKGFIALLAAAVLVTGITACNSEVEHEHTWDSGVITTAATCTEDGVKTYTCTKCGEIKTTKVISAGHSWDSGEVTTAATCTTDGVKTYTCTACKTTRTSVIPAAHTWNDGTVTTAATCVTKGSKTYTCTVCSETKTEEIAELYSSPIDVTTGEAATSSSKYVYFGVFPKTVLTEGTVTLDEGICVTMGGNTYYKGDDGEYYAMVKNPNPYDDTYTYSDTTTVTRGTQRYFKVEPIKWKVLTTDYNNTGKALLLAEDIITANVQYYVSSSSRTIGESTVYANNYKYSTIRAYLNGLDYYNDSNTAVSTYSSKGFLQTAFTENAQSLINTTTVVNDGTSTTNAAGTLPKADGSNSSYPTDYTCEDTQDKIFLLSEQEVTTTAYGFEENNARIRKTTDYAKANYAYQSTTDGYGGWWWLRSPYFSDSDHARIVLIDGYADINDFVDFTLYGVVPALSISF